MNNLQEKKQKKLNKEADKSDTIKKGALKPGGKAVEKRIKKAKADFLEIFQENIAIVTSACLKAKISRDTFYDWCKKDKRFAQKIEEIRNEQIDSVEDRLLKQILNDNPTCIIFYLKSRHPKYKPKMDVDLGNKGDRAFKINISVIKKTKIKNEANKLATNGKTKLGVEISNGQNNN